MIAPTLVGIISIFISRLRTPTNWKLTRLLVIFFPIFIFLSIRNDYGNDYQGYLDMFNEISSQTEMIYSQDYWHAEIGWLALNRIYKHFGFHAMLASLALLSCYAYSRLILTQVPPRYYWLALFIYVFIPENLLIQSSAMRQAVAITLAILSSEFAIKRNWTAYLILNLTAVLFHTSALFFFAFSLVALPNISIKRFWIPILMGIYIIFSAYASTIVLLMQNLLSIISGGIFDRYAIYNEKAASASGLGAIFFGLQLFLLLLFFNAQTRAGRFAFKMSIIAIFLSALSSEIVMLARIGYYFNVFNIASVPLLATQMAPSFFRLSFIFTYMAYGIFVYYQFFLSPIWHDSFSKYATIIQLIF